MFTHQHRKMTCFVSVGDKPDTQFRLIMARGWKLTLFLAYSICVLCSVPYPTVALLVSSFTVKRELYLHVLSSPKSNK